MSSESDFICPWKTHLIFSVVIFSSLISIGQFIPENEKLERKSRFLKLLYDGIAFVSITER
jgi:hypothetical protein